MNARTRASATGFHQAPPSFSALATITPSACASTAATFSGVTPLPTSSGSCVAARAVGDDRVGAVLDVHVGEHPDPLGPQPGKVAGRGGRGSLQDPLVGHVGVGPLVDAHEAGATRLGDRQRVPRTVRQHVDTERQTYLAAPRYPGAPGSAGRWTTPMTTRARPNRAVRAPGLLRWT